MKNMKKLFVIYFMVLTQVTCAQVESLYRPLNNDGLLYYRQINEDPVIVFHDQCLSENNMPNYIKGLHFVVGSPAFFETSDDMYAYLTDNQLFAYEDRFRPGSYYNKNATHQSQRQLFFNNGVEAYNKSLILSDEEVKESKHVSSISIRRYQLVATETYIKDGEYEFLFIEFVDVYKADIDPKSSGDVDKVVNFFKRAELSEIDYNNIKRGTIMECFIKENGFWKACYPLPIYQYWRNKGYDQLIKDKANYDVLSTVENGVRVYEQVGN